jgi:hypothetical protein
MKTVGLHGVWHFLTISAATDYVIDWSHRPINRCANILTVSSIKLRHFEAEICVEIPSTEAELSVELYR